MDLADDKSPLVQVMAWFRQATSHFLGQCWRRFMSPYGVTGPQWVNVFQISGEVCLTHRSIAGYAMLLNNSWLQVIWQAIVLMWRHWILDIAVTPVQQLMLTHWCLMEEYGRIYLGQQWLRWWLVAPSHSLNQCWLHIREVLWQATILHSTKNNFLGGATNVNS